MAEDKDKKKDSVPVTTNTLSDVAARLDRIWNGLETGEMAESKGRLQLGVTKQWLKMAELRLQHERAQRGKKPEREITLTREPDSDPPLYSQLSREDLIKLLEEKNKKL
jgi:hypothetical protein